MLLDNTKAHIKGIEARMRDAELHLGVLCVSHRAGWKTADDAINGRTETVCWLLEAFGQDRKKQFSFFEYQGNRNRTIQKGERVSRG